MTTVAKAEIVTNVFNMKGQLVCELFFRQNTTFTITTKQ